MIKFLLAIALLSFGVACFTNGLALMISLLVFTFGVGGLVAAGVLSFEREEDE